MALRPIVVDDATNKLPDVVLAAIPESRTVFNQTLYADKLPTSTGLTSLVPQDGGNATPFVQAALDYIKATYGGGTLVLPAYNGYMRFTTPLTIPSKVRLVGNDRNTTILSFFFMDPTLTAITYVGDNAAPLANLSIIGPQTGAGNTFSATTSTGLNITGRDLTFSNLSITGFNVGIKLANTNTFLHTWENIIIGTCRWGIDLDLSGTIINSAAVAGAGRKIVFNNSSISNSVNAFAASGNGLKLFFRGLNMEYLRSFGTIKGAHVYFDDSHFETNGVADGTTWGTVNPYLIDMTENARLYMNNMSVFTGTKGVYTLLNPAGAPFNYPAGRFLVTNSTVYYEMPVGGGAQVFSEHALVIANAATAITAYSFWLSKYNAVKVTPASQDGNFPQAGLTGYVSAADYATGSYTVTLSSAATKFGLWEISF